jgi:hypothetical protein
MKPKKLTNCERTTGVFEEKHEQANSPEAKPLVPRRKRLLQLILINKPTPILIHHLKAADHSRVGAGWKTRLAI